MRTISEHIYDIAYNSIKAKAKNIELIIEENKEKNIIRFSITDDGFGIEKEKMEHIFDPFFTSRDKKIRKVGLGLPLLKQNVELTNGEVKMESELGKGTFVEAVFKTDDIDIPDVGDVAGTITGLLSADIDINWTITLIGAKGKEELSSFELKEALGDIPLNNIRVIGTVKELILNLCEEVF